MRRILLFLLIPILLTGTTFGADAAQRQFDVLGGQELIGALPDSVANELRTDSDLSSGFWDTAGRIVKIEMYASHRLLRDSIRASATLLAIVLFCAASGMFVNGAGRNAVVLVGVIALFVSSVADVKILISAAVDAINELYSFSQLLLPVISAACAASGSITVSAAIYSGTALFLQLLISFIKSLLVPLVYAFLALSAADAAFGTDSFGKIRKFLGSTVKNGLRTVLFLFGAYLSITGIISGNADKLTLKAAKMTVSSVVPVVGGMVSDATETVLVGAKMVLNSVGTVGMLAVLSILLIPFLRIGIRYLILQITTALCSVFGLKEHIKVLDAIGSAMGYLLAMTSCCAVMAFVSCVCYMKVSVV